MALWEQVEARQQQVEQRHREVLQMYADLQQQQVNCSDSWLEQRLEKLKTQLQGERWQREQVRPWTHLHLVTGSHIEL